MTNKQSKKTDKALKLVAEGATWREAAKKAKVSPSTVWRALQRAKEPAPTTTK